MLSYSQFQQLQEAYATVDSMYDEIDEAETETTVDPGDLMQLVETWLFMYEALRSLGHFSVVRMDTTK